jgi:putative SOS response-associated peptidase YedK
MCGRLIQSSGPLRYAILEGMDVRDSRVHNYPARWNGAPSQDLLVIRRNRQTGDEVSLDPLRWGLIPYWCGDPKGGRKPINAKAETVRTLPTFRDAYARRRCIIPIDGFFEWKAIKGRVEMWRGGCRLNISVAASFDWRCLSGSTMAPFPHPAHR